MQKNANFVVNFFGENILKNRNIGPWLGEFSLVGRLLTFGNVMKIKEVAQICVLLSLKAKVMHLFWQNTSWATFWAIFSQTHLGPMLWFFKYFRRKIQQKNCVFD
jgi:hypothetical protein